MLLGEKRIDFALRIALGAVAGAYLINLGLLGFLIGDYDYDHLSGYYEIAWRFWRDSGGWPDFNPYLCGGRSLGADPQIPLFHPLVLLVPIIGPTWTLKLEMLGQVALGTYGLVRWLQLLKLDRRSVQWGAFLFLTGGGVVARFLVGHSAMGYLFLSPLFFYLHRRMADAKFPRNRKLFAGYFALFAYAALYKPNFAIYFVPLLLCEHFAWAAVRRSARAAYVPVLAFVFAIGANAIVYYPAHRYFADFPRFSETVQMHYSPLLIFPNLLLPLKSIPHTWFHGALFGPHEYNIFLGPVAFVLAFFGFRQKLRKYRADVISLSVLAVAAFLVGLGVPYPPAKILFPFTWLASFWPGFASVRVPSRFWFGVTFFFLVLSSISFSAFAKKRYAWLVVTLGVLLPGTFYSTYTLSRISLRSHQTQWQGESRRPPEFIWDLNDADRSYATIRDGHGALNCMYNMETFQSPALRPGAHLAVTANKRVAVKARFIDWRHIALHITGENKANVALNLNHSPYWHYEGTGAKIISEFKQPLTLLTDDFAQGTLVFEQPGLRTGTWISIATILGALAFFYAGKFSMKMRSAGSGSSKRKTRE